MPDGISVTEPADLSERGLGFYSGRVVYRQRFDVEKNTSLCGVAIENLANHAIVRMDGQEVGRILWRPWRLDCDIPLQTGEHEIEIEVTNTQGNQMLEHQLPLGILGKVNLNTIE